MKTPKYKIGDVVVTSYGRGKVYGRYEHALDPETPPQVWLYRVMISDADYNGINPATFQESEISPRNVNPPTK